MRSLSLVHLGVWLGLVLTVTACSGGDDDVTPTSEPTPTPGPVDPRERLTCEVVIVGGGAGGLHTAFRLAPTLGDGVCLFEKQDELGGRIHDIPLDENDPESPRFGAGARRVMEGQSVLLNLATELGLTLETPVVEADLLGARGVYAFSKESLLPLYPSITPDESGDTETALYDALRFSPERDNASSYPDFRSYIRSVVGDEEYWFLHDMSRFRADFEYPLDARGYLDYFDEEWDVCCTPSYPVGGMSAFIEGMATQSSTSGARIFTGEPVVAVRSSGVGYQIETENYIVSAGKVVIAVPPTAFQWLEGDVIDQLASQPQFQDIIAVKVATVTQWWPERWWADVVNPTLESDNHIWRAWTTEHCLNFIEIPLEPYGVEQKVTRSVYDDDLNCVQFWEGLGQQGTAAVEAEVKRGLEKLFNNGVSEPATVVIPDPVKTHLQIWPDAWHWLRAGSTFTNADIFAWAVEPLPGEDVALVGEAYNPQRSGWSDGAYKSSINLLNSRYGMDLPGLNRAVTARRLVWSEGGH